LILLLLLAPLALYFLLSSALLNRFYPYVDPGGSPIGKIHPGSYVLILSLFCTMALLGPGQFLARAFGGRLWLSQFAAVLAITAAYLISRFGISGLAYLIDCHLAALFGVMIAGALPASERALLLRIMVFAVIINAGIAVAERVLGVHLVPHFQFTDFGFFRSSAFLGHPLHNGLIVGSIGIAALFLPWPLHVRAAMALLILAALMSFASRASLMIYCAAAGTAALAGAGLAVVRNRAKPVYLYWAPIVLVVGVLALAVMASATDIGERLGAIFAGDESVEERFDAWRIFRLVLWEDLLRGVDLATIQLLIEKDPDLQIIENFWIFLALNLGLGLFVIFAISFIWFLRGVAKEGGAGAVLCVGAFLVAASTNNSLSTKTPALLFAAVAFMSISAARRFPARPGDRARPAPTQGPMGLNWRRPETPEPKAQG
jgi:hypothetical protein